MSKILTVFIFLGGLTGQTIGYAKTVRMQHTSGCYKVGSGGDCPPSPVEENSKNKLK